MTTYICDSHIHTRFSTDSDSSVKETIEKAIELGMKFLAITDHQDFGYPGEDFKLIKNIDEYFEKLLYYKEEYKDKIYLAIGCEVGLEADKPDIIKEYVSSKPFDFIIGSSHLVNGIDIYYPDFYKDKTSDEAIKIYFESVLQNLDTCKDFDVYGHIDYIVRYCPGKTTCFTYEKFGKYLDEILVRIIEAGKGIEINTGGYRNGLTEPNPCFDIIKKYKQLGGKILTFGSDAHEPAVIGYRFADAALLAKEAGFTAYYIFKNRQAIELPLI